MKKLLLLLLIFALTLPALHACRLKTELTADDMNMADVHSLEQRKQRFFDFLRPIIESENDSVRKLRRSLLAAREDANRQNFVADTADQYSVTWTDDDKNWNKLLERVDTVPAEIVMAQAALETNWGKSRFALQGNNFFGQWCYQPGCGIVPAKRNDGKSHEVARFKSVNASVRSYLKNLNTNRAYYPLREIRRTMREAGQQPDAIALAGGLVRYSERRDQYVKAVKRIIMQNSALMLGS